MSNPFEFITRSACPICNQTGGQILADYALDAPPISDYLRTYYGGTVPIETLSAGHYVLIACPQCHACYQRDILADAGMDALYETWIQPAGSLLKKQTASAEVRAGFARQAMQIIAAVKLPPHEIKVLDFGMGWGTWLQMVRAFGMQAEGLELSPNRIAHAEAQGLSVVSPQQIQPESYHFINAEQVFEHLAEPQAVLASCYAWLKPNGWLRVAVPNGAEIPKMIQNGRWEISAMPSIPLEHINVFTPASLALLLKNGGFSPLPPPLVLPLLRPSLSDFKQFMAVLGLGLLARFGLGQTTTLWAQKRPK